MRRFDDIAALDATGQAELPVAGNDEIEAQEKRSGKQGTGTAAK